MTESLLSFSGLKLFGHQILEIKIVNPFTEPPTQVTVAATRRIKLQGLGASVDGHTLASGDKVIAWKQFNPEKNDVYLVKNGDWDVVPIDDGKILTPTAGTEYVGKKFIKLNSGFEFIDDGIKKPGTLNRYGHNKFLQYQLSEDDARFARIYGFTFENVYYDLSKPVLFLVHGDGELASEETGKFSAARSPGATSLTGLGAADFDFADGLRVWSYDKADYTIRMDVETGMFDDVLLAAMLGGGPGGMDSAGMNARGMNARGMNARGMNARGMNARGMNARGGGNSD
jgi:hypothetical protein